MTIYHNLTQNEQKLVKEMFNGIAFYYSQHIGNIIYELNKDNSPGKNDESCEKSKERIIQR